MFEHAQSAMSPDSLPYRHRPTPSVALRRVPEDADATGAPWWGPLAASTSHAEPQADGCP